jgi:hypothetical protein
MGSFNKFILCLFLASASAFSCNPPQEKKVKPNFVFIFIDDMGWKDVGFMGSAYYETPHIDQLAKMVWYSPRPMRMQPIVRLPVPVC